MIRNAKLESEWEPVERGLLPIGARTISSLIRTQGIGDLFKIHLVAQEDGIDVKYADIPTDFDAPSAEPFDKNYMRALFERGYQDDRARSGKALRLKNSHNLPSTN